MPCSSHVIQFNYYWKSVHVVCFICAVCALALCMEPIRRKQANHIQCWYRTFISAFAYMREIRCCCCCCCCSIFSSVSCFIILRVVCMFQFLLLSCHNTTLWLFLSSSFILVFAQSIQSKLLFHFFCLRSDDWSFVFDLYGRIFSWVGVKPTMTTKITKTMTTTTMTQTINCVIFSIHTEMVLCLK